MTTDDALYSLLLLLVRPGPGSLQRFMANAVRSTLAVFPDELPLPLTVADREPAAPQHRVWPATRGLGAGEYLAMLRRVTFEEIKPPLPGLPYLLDEQQVFDVLQPLLDDMESDVRQVMARALAADGNVLVTDVEPIVTRRRQLALAYAVASVRLAVLEAKKKDVMYSTADWRDIASNSDPLGRSLQPRSAAWFQRLEGTVRSRGLMQKLVRACPPSQVRVAPFGRLLCCMDRVAASCLPSCARAV